MPEQLHGSRSIKFPYVRLLNDVLFLCHQVAGHTSVFINEPKLSDFKQILVREGIPAEFSGGVLICNNLVAVRRVSGHIISQHALVTIHNLNCVDVVCGVSVMLLTGDIYC